MFVRWARRAGNPASSEPRNYSETAKKKLRPDIVCSLNASTIAGDVQIINPLSLSNQIEDPMDSAANAKIRKYQNLVKSAPVLPADRFVPLIFMTTGAWHPMASTFAAEIAASSRSFTAWEVEQNIISEVAIAIQRGNAWTITSSLAAAHYEVGAAGAAAAGDQQQPAQDDSSDNDG